MWSLAFDLFSIGDPTRSLRLQLTYMYSVVLGVIETSKLLHHDKVVTPFRADFRVAIYSSTVIASSEKKNLKIKVMSDYNIILFNEK